jgi:hypothetical protein
MLGVNITCTGIDTIQNNLTTLTKGFTNLDWPMKKFVDDVVIPDTKKAYSQGGFDGKKWPKGFKPPEGLKEYITKKANLNIVVTKSSVKITPKRISVADNRNTSQVVKRGTVDSKNKRGADPSVIVRNLDGSMVIAKPRAGTPVHLLTLNKQGTTKKLADIFKLYVVKMGKGFQK